MKKFVTREEKKRFNQEAAKLREKLKRKMLRHTSIKVMERLSALTDKELDKIIKGFQPLSKSEK